MTPAEMSRLHRAAFVQERGWSQAEFADLLRSPHVHCLALPGGFALTRTLAGESELLTLAVDPASQRQGIARKLMQSWLQDIAGQAEQAFLEVASDNLAARALYAGFGFDEIACRPSYYARPQGPAADALVLRHSLSQRP